MTSRENDLLKGWNKTVTGRICLIYQSQSVIKKCFHITRLLVSTSLLAKQNAGLCSFQPHSRHKLHLGGASPVVFVSVFGSLRVAVRSPVLLRIFWLVGRRCCCGLCLMNCSCCFVYTSSPVLRAGMLGSGQGPFRSRYRCLEPSSPSVCQFDSGFHSNRASTYPFSRVPNTLRGPDPSAATLYLSQPLPLLGDRCVAQKIITGSENCD